MTCKDCTHNHDCIKPTHIVKSSDVELKCASFEITENSLKQTVLKDSGNRTVFNSGAVRDMHEGKGRCDLLPLDIVAKIIFNFEPGNQTYSDILVNINNFEKTGIVKHLYHAIHNFKYICKWSYSEMFRELAIHFENGAKKYGVDNWKRGIPANCYIDSAIRHLLKYKDCFDDEDHDRAFIWNILCCIWTCEHIPELNNYKTCTADN